MQHVHDVAQVQAQVPEQELTAELAQVQVLALELVLGPAEAAAQVLALGPAEPQVQQHWSQQALPAGSSSA